MAFRQDHLGDRTQRHQDHRDQRGPDAHAKARHFRFAERFRVVQSFRDRLVDAFEEFSVDRACQNHGRDGQQRTVEQGFAHIGVEDSRNRGWARVRWQETVSHGKRRRHRNANKKQRDARGCSDSKYQRQQQHETDFIEQGETDCETG